MRTTTKDNKARSKPFPGHELYIKEFIEISIKIIKDMNNELHASSRTSGVTTILNGTTTNSSCR